MNAIFLALGLVQQPASLERRITRDGMVSVGGNLYSVPNTAHRRPFFCLDAGCAW